MYQPILYEPRKGHSLHFLVRALTLVIIGFASIVGFANITSFSSPPTVKTLAVGTDRPPQRLPASATSSWTDAGTLADARRSHTATLLPGGKVLVVGGYGIN